MADVEVSLDKEMAKCYTGINTTLQDGIY